MFPLDLTYSDPSTRLWEPIRHKHKIHTKITCRVLLNFVTEFVSFLLRDLLADKLIMVFGKCQIALTYGTDPKQDVGND